MIKAKKKSSVVNPRTARPKRHAGKAFVTLDSDSDGLSDLQEKDYGTDPHNPDTDGDGLSDYEEIKVYGSDPLNPDTNGNGIRDGLEVKMGRNPAGRGGLQDMLLGTAANSYRPQLLKKERLFLYGLSAAAVKLIVIAFVLLLPLSAWVTPDILANQAQEIIRLTNELRQNSQIPPLVPSEKLSQVAYDKAQDMLVGQYFSHTGPDGKIVADWLAGIGYNYDSAGENLAMGFSSAADVVNAWSKSPTHYANMIDRDFTEIGVGLAVGNYKDFDTTFVTQIFGSPKVTAQLEAKSTVASESTSTIINQSEVKLKPKNNSVLGIKISAPLDPPVIISPLNQLVINTSTVATKIYAPEAESVGIYSKDRLLASSTINQTTFIFETEISLPEGTSDLSARATAGERQQNSATTTITIDTRPPTITDNQAQLFVSDSINGQKAVRAEAILSPDTVSAQVIFGNYKINLQPSQTIPGQWTGSLIIFDQAEEQIFNPVVLPVISVSDGAGNQMNYDIDWNNVKPVKTSIIKQYFWAKGGNGQYSWLFTLSSWYLRILFAIVVLVFAGNLALMVKNKIAYFDRRFILFAAGFIVFLLLLLLV